MKKVLILLLVVGVLIGTFTAVEVLCENSSQENVDFPSDSFAGAGYGDPAPCGEGGPVGGGGGAPG